MLATQLRILFSIQFWITDRVQKGHEYGNRPFDAVYLPHRRLHPVRPKKDSTVYD